MSAYRLLTVSAVLAACVAPAAGQFFTYGEVYEFAPPVYVVEPGYLAGPAYVASPSYVVERQTVVERPVVAHRRAPARVVYEPTPVEVVPPEVVYEGPPPAVVYTPSRVCREKCGEAEIDSLGAKACRRAEGLEVRVRYEVELEDMPPGEYDLVVRFLYRGLEISDEEGRPFTAVVPLDRPKEVDDDELEFKGSTRVLLPAPDRMKHLKIRAEIVERGTGRVLDRETEEVD